MSHVYEADATDINTLAELKVHTLDVVAVTIGSHLEAALPGHHGPAGAGSQKIMVKASSPLHKSP